VENASDGEGVKESMGRGREEEKKHRENKSSGYW
jgi:hypothetical protein